MIYHLPFTICHCPADKGAGAAPATPAQPLAFGAPLTGRAACTLVATQHAEAALLALRGAQEWAALGDGERVRFCLSEACGALQTAHEFTASAAKCAAREEKAARKAAKKKGRK
jgi:hypothetical protein